LLNKFVLIKIATFTVFTPKHIQVKPLKYVNKTITSPYFYYRLVVRFTSCKGWIYKSLFLFTGRKSSVGIVTGYGWTVRGSNPGGTRFSAPVQTALGAHPASCKMGTGSFPGGKERPGREPDISDPSSFVVLKSITIPLLPLWTVCPVQSLSACTRVHFTFLPLFLFSPEEFYEVCIRQSVLHHQAV